MDDASFEAWADRKGLYLSDRWLYREGWEAGRLAALEECAKVCDELADDHVEDSQLTGDERFAVYAKHQRRCASAIRSLSTTPKGEQR